MTVAGSLGCAQTGVRVAVARAFERGDFDRCESYRLDLLELSGVYRDALAWVEQAAPHLT
jgi:hypothetical protein